VLHNHVSHVSCAEGPDGASIVMRCVRVWSGGWPSICTVPKVTSSRRTRTKAGGAWGKGLLCRREPTCQKGKVPSAVVYGCSRRSRRRWRRVCRVREKGKSCESEHRTRTHQSERTGEDPRFSWRWCLGEWVEVEGGREGEAVVEELIRKEVLERRAPGKVSARRVTGAAVVVLLPSEAIGTALDDDDLQVRWCGGWRGSIRGGATV
jgi:hypothetical protein